MSPTENADTLGDETEGDDNAHIRERERALNQDRPLIGVGGRLPELEAEYSRLLAEGLEEEADRLGLMIDYLGHRADAVPDTLTTALELASRGFAVFPAIGKQPDGHWPSLATTDVERIVLMWAGKPERNIGISCKESHLLVVDEDRPGGFAEAAASVGESVPETYTVATSKGFHRYFRVPEDSTLGNSRGRFAEFGCDIRGPGGGGGGYVIAAGSTHASGVVYTEVDPDAKVADLPEWVVGLINGRALVLDTNGPIVGPDSRSTFVLPPVIAGPHADGSGGERHHTMVSYAASLLAQSVPIEVAREAMRSAWRRCEQPPTATSSFPLVDAERILDDIYRAHPPGRSTGSQVAGERSEQEVGDRPAPVPLDVFLDTLDPAFVFLVDGVLPSDTNVLLSAQFKAGKSTLAANLGRSIADRTPFLGAFDVLADVGGTVQIVDDELSEDQLRRELRAQGVGNPAQIGVTSLRGRVSQFDIHTETGLTYWAEKFEDAGTAVLIIDCLAPIMSAFGLSEDRETGRFTTALNELQFRAGIAVVILIHHMGHSGERPRGDSALRGWCDVEWKLVRPVGKGEDGRELDDPRAARYFSAYGRGVDVPEGKVEFDANSRHLTYVQGDRRASRINGVVLLVRDYLAASGPSSKKGIEKGIGHKVEDVRAAIERGIAEGFFTLTVRGNAHEISLTSSLSSLLVPPDGTTLVKTSSPRLIGDEITSEGIGDDSSSRDRVGDETGGDRR